MSSSGRQLGRFLYRMTAAIQRFAWAVLMTAAILSGGLLFYALTHLGINTNTSGMFSLELPWFQQFNEFRDEFPALDANVLVVIDGPVPERVDEAQRKLAERLQETPAVYGMVLAIESSPFFRRNALLFLSPDELQTFGDRLAVMQPVLGRLGQQPHLAGFLSLLADSLEADADPPAELEQTMTRLTRLFEEAAEGDAEAISWQTLLDEQAAEDSYRRVILVAPRLDFAGAEPRKRVLAGIREQIQLLGLGESDGLTLRLSGSLALQQEELESVGQGIVQGALLTLLLVIVILMLTFRSWRLFAASLLTLFFGLIITAAFAAAGIGHLNLISIAFAVLYIGLGIDFAIHYCLHYRELLSGGHSHEQAIREASGDTGVSLVLCAASSSIGFLAFVPTAFAGVAELGLISGFGMFASLLATLVLLPALLHLFGPPRNVGIEHSPLLFALIGRFSTRHLVTVRLGVLLLAVAAIWLAAQAHFDSNPLHLRDPDSESVSTYYDLLNDARTSPLTLSFLSPAEAAPALKEEITALPEVKEVREIADFVPAGQEEKMAMLDDLTLMLGEPAPIILAAPEVDRDVSAIRSLAARLLDASRVNERELGRAMQGWLAEQDAAGQEQALTKLSEAALGTFPLTWNRLVDGFAATPFGVSELPPELRSLWLSADGRQRVEIIPAQALTDMAQIKRFIEAVESHAPGASGLPAIEYYGGQTVATSFVQAIATALVCVFLLLLLLLRDFRRTLVVIAPLLLATTLTAASTVLLNMPFNFANVITLPLLIGVGVDNGIHMVQRHHNSAIQNREGAGLTTSSTPRAILFSTLTTIASFGTLAFSQHPGTASMGILLTVGMVASLLSALFVIPALLPRDGTLR
ncbi:MAG: efflux RND transporter permease subunit [Pseudomonadales bacterium]|nr:efflux RND transporter permease subunit [Pseudomonadales bacterium]